MSKNKHQNEEKLMTVWYQIVDFFEKNKKHVYTALIILVIAVAGIILLVQKKKANNEIAGMELSKIKNVYESNNFQQAINGDSLGISKGLQYIVDEYGSTENGELAKIMLANSYYSVRDFDKADKYFKDYAGSNPVLKAASIAGIASVYNAKEQYSEAAKEYEKAAAVDKTNPFIDQYLFYAATNYFKANNLEESKKVFAKLKDDFPKSKYIFESEKYKASLN